MLLYQVIKDINFEKGIQVSKKVIFDTLIDFWLTFDKATLYLMILIRNWRKTKSYLFHDALWEQVLSISLLLHCLQSHQPYFAEMGQGEVQIDQSSGENFQ